MTRYSSRRGGFTLIELLTAMGIIALLAALTAAGIQRVRSGQMSRNTEQTVAKLQLAMDQKWKDVADRVMDDKLKKRIPADVVTLCNRDTERAAALWMYIQTRREFPQSFSEATSAISITGLPATAAYLQPRQTYSSATGGSLGAEEQAAVLLYLILSDNAGGGTDFAADQGMRGAQDTIGGSFRVFMDAWKTPITFRRYGQSSELSQSPYVRPGSTLNDPLDPQGKLPYFITNNAAAYSSMQSAFGVPFDNTNRQVAVISAGANRNIDGTYDQDNVVGYRLRRQGDRGD